MVIEVGICNRQYALDTVNVVLCDLKLEEDPNFKVKNFRLEWAIYSIVTAVLSIISLLLTLHYRNLFLGVCTGVCVFCFARGYGYILATGKIMKQMMCKEHSITYTFSAEEVVCDTNDKKKVSYRWEYFRYIKIYGCGIYFIPRKKADSIMAVPAGYEEDVRKFLDENHIELDIYAW